MLFRSDHAPLEYIQRSSDKCSRLSRWALRLTEYNFQIQYRTGPQQKHVDCLSRDPLPVEEGQEEIKLDEFPSRAVLNVTRWEEQSTRTPRPQMIHFWETMRQLMQKEVSWWKKQKWALSEQLMLMQRDETKEQAKLVTYQLDCAPAKHVRAVEVIEVEDSPSEGEVSVIQELSTVEQNPLFGGRNIPPPPPIASTTMQQLQEDDSLCKLIRTLMNKPQEQWPERLRGLRAKFETIEGVICIRFVGEQPRIVVPVVARDSIIHAHHLSYYSGHFGLHKTYLRVRQRYWWPSLKDNVKQFLKACMLCMAYAPDGKRQRWLNMPIGTPFEIVAIDIWGALPPTDDRNEYVIVMIDHHTRWVELVPVANPTAALVADAIFQHWIARWGVPRVILTDNGPQFRSVLYETMCQKYQIKRMACSPYNPRGNSVVESYMRSLKATVRLCLQVFKSSWDVVLPAAAFAYRTAVHLSTGYSPYFLVTGQNAVLPISRELHEPILNQEGESWLKTIWICRKKLLEEYQKQAIEREMIVDQQGLKFKEGQIIAIKMPIDKRRKAGKFSSQYEGPYRVVQVLANGKSARAVELASKEEVVVNRVNAKLLDLPPTKRVDVYLPTMSLP